MKRVPQVLQLAVIVEGGRPFASETQPFEKLDLLLGRVTPEGGIRKKRLEAGLLVDRWAGFPFHKIDLLEVRGGQATVQNNLHPEGREVDVPRFNQRIEKREAVCGRDV